MMAVTGFLRSVRYILLAIALIAITTCSSPYPAPPDTRKGPVVDVIHGVEFTDDYRWLENQDAPETRQWIAAQNEYAETIVGESPLRERIRTRLSELLDLPEVGTPRRAGSHEYFTIRRKGGEAPVIYRRPVPEDEDLEEAEPDPDGRYEVVLDPADIDPTYRTLLSMMNFSPDGDVMMYSVRDGGAGEIEIRFLDLDNLADLPDRLPRALYASVNFDEEGEGLYYTHRSREVGPRIRHHAFGSPPTDDEEIFGDGLGPTSFLNMNSVGDGRYRIFGVQHGWARNDVYIQDLEGSGEIRPVVVGLPAHFTVRFREGRLYVRTDMDAPMYRLMVADPERPEPEHWEELIPESEDLFETYSFIDGRIYATYLHDVSDRIRVFAEDGTLVGEVEIPDHLSATIRGDGDGKASLTLRGHLQPNTTYDLDLSKGERLVSEESEVPRLGVTGASNGGLLVASAMTQRPDLFRAVLCAYPDLDMVRFNTFRSTNNLPALLEYGDASIPEQFEAIRQYSPYQAVRDGVDYPAVMLTTGDLDTRVPPLQARRMTARLQAATSSGLPVILYYDERGGHAAGRGRPVSLRIEDSAREITFLAQQLGLGVERE